MASIELAVGLGANNYKTLTVLKTMRAELATDPELVAMFLNEARLCARLNHTNLVRVYEVVEAAQPYIVMEYLEGVSMADLHRNLGARFDCVMQLRIISDVLAGLHYAHELCDYDGKPLGIVHRDVSPQNIVVTYDGWVKLLDFGIAKALDDPNKTQAGIVKGKISYMSPEQFAGERLDRRTDIFAIGCMLWRAATGQKLWSKMASEDIARHLVRGEIPRPSSVKNVDRRLTEIVMRATAPERELRYGTAAELRADIDEYLTTLRDDRNLGDWLRSGYATEIQERRSNIDALVSDVTSLAPLTFKSDVPTQIILPRPKRRALGGALGALIILSFVAGLGVLIGAKYEALSNTTPRKTADEQSIQLRVMAEPKRSQILVDGQLAKENPATIRLSRGETHEILVRHEGFQTASRKVQLDRDTSLDFVLSPEVPTQASGSSLITKAPLNDKKPVRPRQVAAKEESPVTVAPETSPPGDPCSCPFYFQNGIKVYKPECL
jgi:serine/threonine protein kinase